MITDAQFKKRIDDLIDDDFISALKEQCFRLYRSGAIDNNDYEDDYRLPKICLYVALSWMKTQYQPLSVRMFKEEVEKLENI